MEARLGRGARGRASRAQLARGRPRTKAAIFTFDTRLDEVTPFTTGFETSSRASSTRSRRSARRRCTTRSRETAERLRTSRRLAPRRDRLHRRQRQRQPADAERGVRHRQRDRRAGLHHRHRADDRQPVGGQSGASAEQSALAGSLSDLATWTGGHTFVASTPAERSVVGAADCRRAAPSVSRSRSNRAANRAGIRSWSVRATRI